MLECDKPASLRQRLTFLLEMDQVEAKSDDFDCNFIYFNFLLIMHYLNKD